MKQGPEGDIHPDDFEILTMVFESCIKIKQIDAETAVYNHCHLAKHVNNAMNTWSATD